MMKYVMDSSIFLCSILHSNERITIKDFYIGKFIDELENSDYESFLTRLEAFFADIPYELNDQPKGIIRLFSIWFSN